MYFCTHHIYTELCETTSDFASPPSSSSFHWKRVHNDECAVLFDAAKLNVESIAVIATAMLMLQHGRCCCYHSACFTVAVIVIGMIVCCKMLPFVCCCCCYYCCKKNIEICINV